MDGPVCRSWPVQTGFSDVIFTLLSFPLIISHSDLLVLTHRQSNRLILQLQLINPCAKIHFHWFPSLLKLFSTFLIEQIRNVSHSGALDKLWLLSLLFETRYWINVKSAAIWMAEMKTRRQSITFQLCYWHTTYQVGSIKLWMIHKSAKCHIDFWIFLQLRHWSDPSLWLSLYTDLPLSK